MGYADLKRIFRQADDLDLAEGRLAYPRYGQLLSEIADAFECPFPRTVAAFAALSPNSDYLGNLRSLVSVLGGIRAGKLPDEITVSTYKACRNRAYSYATGQVDFLDTVRGPKIRAFYANIVDPKDPRPVTIDGHMAAAFRSNAGTMKDNIVRRREYEEIAKEVRRLARHVGMVPNQVQATIWFTRKRLLNVKYNPQFDLFGDPDNRWKTLIKIEEIRPYP